MTLSEAIRAGSKLQQQVFMGWAMNWERGTGTCALGAACQALGIATFDVGAAYSDLRRRYPWLVENCGPPRSVPIDEDEDAITIIYLLNDHEHWTREQIADWVETVEPKEER